MQGDPQYDQIPKTRRQRKQSAVYTEPIREGKIEIPDKRPEPGSQMLVEWGGFSPLWKFRVIMNFVERSGNLSLPACET